ncbi:hypothetical protein DPEC_G00112870 [Dallia pectoralis]|uniref:Uncharacterized protein n=1 Tax=Dallia pectoralis TaxID=75939 RepID=A0ACC2GTL5_DALPE|nr:hypothetical protein DPEC_G00112870 [Dallia pectoralis]
MVTPGGERKGLQQAAQEHSNTWGLDMLMGRVIKGELTAESSEGWAGRGNEDHMCLMDDLRVPVERQSEKGNVWHGMKSPWPPLFYPPQPFLFFSSRRLK